MGRSKAVDISKTAWSMTMRRKQVPQYEVYDKLFIGGWEFDIKMVLLSRWGLASALQGGRVISLELYQSGEPIAIFDEGEWVVPLSKENEPASIALTYFLEKHNKKRTKAEERSMWIHEY